jgi:hypothetical protein
MDEIINDVNIGWNDGDPSRAAGMQFKGSDDYLRTKVSFLMCPIYWADRAFAHVRVCWVGCIV